MTAPRWLELLVRMTAGEQEEDPFIGVLEVLHDDDPTWPSSVRVFKDRARYRVEDLDGTLLTIRNAEHTFVFGGMHEEDGSDDGSPWRYANGEDGWYRPGAYGNVIERREPQDWRGDDFTSPTGPARAVTYLGRDAWEIELAPPERKPSPLVLTIDAVNGMTYERRSVRFGVLTRWTQLEVVGSHDDGLFTWDGEAHWYTHGFREVTEEEIETDRRERAEWMANHGVGPVTVTSRVDLHPHEQRDDGGFYASFDASSDGVVARRPASSEAWDLDANCTHVDRWTDGTWDWYVGSDDGPAQLAELRRQLSEPRPGAE